VKWLATYVNVRPEEVRNIQEGHINLRLGEILIPDPKEREPKIIYLIPEDVELIKSLPRGIDPQMYFFRGSDGRQFGEKHFYKWWKRACRNAEVEGVDSYGGTRHSSVRALRKRWTPREIQEASMHSTDESFGRYYWVDGDDLRRVYMETSPGNELAMDIKRTEKAK
jgi:hypothetical protein